MNKMEHKMVDLLQDLRTNYCVSGIKAEFEAEGTRIEEAMRLKDVISKAGLGLNIKIGGCEAIKDMLDGISLGAERIIAPMVETPYALKKFLLAAQMVYGDAINEVDLLVNIETFTGVANFSEMLALPEIGMLKGVVIGRVDMVGSLAMNRTDVNSQRILDISLDIAQKASAKGLDVIIGGGVSVESLSFFNQFPTGQLTRFETRKVIFQCPEALKNPEEAFIKAVEFELLWLKNKRDYYSAISKEDNDRIDMMETRYAAALNKVR